MIESLKEVFRLLTFDERRGFWSLLLLLTVMSLVDVAGIASIMPFLAVISDQNLLNANIAIRVLHEMLGAKSYLDFVGQLEVIVIVSLVFSLFSRAIGTYLQVRFALYREYSLSMRLLGVVLGMPYSWYVHQNKSTLQKTILVEVNQAIGGALIPLLSLFSNVVVSITFILLLIIADPIMATLIGCSLTFIYVVIYKSFGRWIYILGERRLEYNDKRYKTVSDSISGIKEVKVYGLESAYMGEFLDPALKYAQCQTNAGVAAQMPRYILELIVFGGLILIIVSMGAGSNKIQVMIPMLTLYAISGYRLLPSLQQIYASITSINFTKPTVRHLISIFENALKSDDKVFEREINFNKVISFKNISFNYPASDKTVLKEISFEIKRGDCILLEGKSGSGKSTFLDLLMGLIEPSDGHILIDGELLNKEVIKSWRSIIGYVPQHVHLIDGTIEENIAFTSSKANIDIQRFTSAVNASGVSLFADNLPEGYKTCIGQDGMMLSGGQRQRVAIARALYRNPKVLILDEATSALDIETEEFVLSSIISASKNMTLIIVTHHIDAVKSSYRLLKI